MKERYRIDNDVKLGRHARFLDAHDTMLNRRVLCRKVKADAGNEFLAIDQVNFFCEMGAIKHPSTVRVLDRHHDPESGDWYLVSEWVEGEALYTWAMNSTTSFDVQTIERFIERILGWMEAWESSRHDFVSIDRGDIVVVYDAKGRIDFKVASGRPSNVRDSLKSFRRLLGWVLTRGRARRLPAATEMHRSSPDLPMRLIRWISWLQCPASEGGPETIREAWVRYYGGLTERKRGALPWMSSATVTWALAAAAILTIAGGLFWAFSKSLGEAVQSDPPTVIEASTSFPE